jgi:hypothetical protein
MGQPDHPDFGVVLALLDVLYLMNPKQLRVQRSLVKVKMKLIHALSGLALLHRFNLATTIHSILGLAGPNRGLRRR